MAGCLKDVLESKGLVEVGTLGIGAQGPVLLVQRRDFSDDKFALKRSIAAEVRALKALARCRNVIALHEDFEQIGSTSLLLDEAKVWACLEYLNGGCLRGLIREYRPTLVPEWTAKRVIYQVLTALKDIHALQWMHRDIKAENVGITWFSSKEMQVRLIDFDTACLVPSASYLSEVVGTVENMAPEVYRSCYNQSADCWSLGVVAFELVTGYRPFNDASINQIEELICNYEKYLTIPFDCVHAQRDFLQRLLTSQDDRMDSERALRHQWLAGVRHACVGESNSIQSECLSAPVTQPWSCSNTENSDGENSGHGPTKPPMPLGTGWPVLNCGSTHTSQDVHSNRFPRSSQLGPDCDDVECLGRLRKSLSEWTADYGDGGSVCRGLPRRRSWTHFAGQGSGILASLPSFSSGPCLPSFSSGRGGNVQAQPCLGRTPVVGAANPSAACVRSRRGRQDRGGAISPRSIPKITSRKTEDLKTDCVDHAAYLQGIRARTEAVLLAADKCARAAKASKRAESAVARNADCDDNSASKALTGARSDTQALLNKLRDANNNSDSTPDMQVPSEAAVVVPTASINIGFASQSNQEQDKEAPAVRNRRRRRQNLENTELPSPTGSSRALSHLKNARARTRELLASLAAAHVDAARATAFTKGSPSKPVETVSLQEQSMSDQFNGDVAVPEPLESEAHAITGSPEDSLVPPGSPTSDLAAHRLRTEQLLEKLMHASGTAKANGVCSEREADYGPLDSVWRLGVSHFHSDVNETGTLPPPPWLLREELSHKMFLGRTGGCTQLPKSM